MRSFNELPNQKQAVCNAGMKVYMSFPDDLEDYAIDALGTMTMMAASDAGLSLAAILAYGNPRYRSLKGKPNPKRRGSDIDLDLIWLLQLGQCILSCIIV